MHTGTKHSLCFPLGSKQKTEAKAQHSELEGIKYRTGKLIWKDMEFLFKHGV